MFYCFFFFCFFINFFIFLFIIIIVIIIYFQTTKIYLILIFHNPNRKMFHIALLEPYNLPTEDFNYMWVNIVNDQLNWVTNRLAGMDEHVQAQSGGCQHPRQGHLPRVPTPLKQQHTNEPTVPHPQLRAQRQLATHCNSLAPTRASCMGGAYRNQQTVYR